MRKFAGFLGMEPAGADICATYCRISQILMGGAAKVNGQLLRPKVSFFVNADMTESCGVELGPLPLSD
jgi:hypothetical protein